MSNRVEDQIVLPSAPREVLIGVINHMVRTERTQEVRLVPVIHTGDLGPIESGKLYGETACRASGAIDQDLLTRPHLSLAADAL